MPWRLQIGNVAFTADDMTLAECERVEEMTGTDWSRLSPVESAKHARAVAHVLLSRVDPATAGDKAGALTVKELLDGFSVVPDDLPTEFVDGIPQSGVGGATAS